MSDLAHTYKENFVPVKPLSRASNDSETHYTYNNQTVQVIVVFNEGDKKTAIVENSRGEQFDVPMDELKLC